LQIEKDGSSVILNWQRRLYDTRGNAHPNARARHNVAQKRRLDTQCHCSTVEVADWRKLLSCIADRNAAALCSTVTDIAEKAKQSQQSHTEHLEVELLTVHLMFLASCNNTEFLHIFSVHFQWTD